MSEGDFDSLPNELPLEFSDAETPPLGAMRSSGSGIAARPEACLEDLPLDLHLSDDDSRRVGVQAAEPELPEPHAGVQAMVDDDHADGIIGDLYAPLVAQIPAPARKRPKGRPRKYPVLPTAQAGRSDSQNLTTTTPEGEQSMSWRGAHMAETLAIPTHIREQVFNMTNEPFEHCVDWHACNRLGLPMEALASGPLAAALRLGHADGEVLDDEALAIAESMLGTRSGREPHLRSKAAFSADLEVDPKRLTVLVKRLAALVFLCDVARVQSVAVLLGLSSARNHLLHCFDIYLPTTRPHWLWG